CTTFGAGSTGVPTDRSTSPPGPAALTARSLAGVSRSPGKSGRSAARRGRLTWRLAYYGAAPTPPGCVVVVADTTPVSAPPPPCRIGAGAAPRYGRPRETPSKQLCRAGDSKV